MIDNTYKEQQQHTIKGLIITLIIIVLISMMFRGIHYTRVYNVQGIIISCTQMGPRYCVGILDQAGAGWRIVSNTPIDVNTEVTIHVYDKNTDDMRDDLIQSITIVGPNNKPVAEDGPEQP